jgi:hypothetical protein
MMKRMWQNFSHRYTQLSQTRHVYLMTLGRISVVRFPTKGEACGNLVTSIYSNQSCYRTRAASYSRLQSAVYPGTAAKVS